MCIEQSMVYAMSEYIGSIISRILYEWLYFLNEKKMYFSRWKIKLFLSAIGHYSTSLNNKSHIFTILSCNIFFPHIHFLRWKKKERKKRTMNAQEKKISKQNKANTRWLILCPSLSLAFNRSTPRNSSAGVTFAYVVHFSEISRKQRKSGTACGSTEMKQRPLPLQHAACNTEPAASTTAAARRRNETNARAHWIRLEEMKNSYSDRHAYKRTRKSTNRKNGRNSHRISMVAYCILQRV